MSIKIFTMTHKGFLPPEDATYVPLQVGRACNQDLGYLGDDTGEHISDLNCFYGELTGIYWLWQNYRMENENDYIGVCHYRRFFCNEAREILTETDYENILSEYDIITSKAMMAGEPYRDYYAKAHNVADLDEEGRVILELFPEYYESFEQAMKGEKHYFANLMVTTKPLFDEYCQWLFTIFAELGNRIDVSGYDAYHKRIFGFLSEQLLLVWVQAKGLKVYECPVMLTDEKVETKELKLAIGQLLKNDQISEARQLFYQMMKIRPDVRLEHSDILGELPLIEQLLYICELEKQQGLAGLLTESRDLATLLKLLKEVIAKLGSYKKGSSEEKELQKVHHITDVALEVIRKNN